MRSLKFLFVSLLLLSLFLAVVSAQSPSPESTVEEVEEEEEPAVDCSQHTACDTCTDESGCVWCDTDLECVRGGFFGPDTWLPSCSRWYQGQCHINGRWYTWYLMIVVLVILLVAGTCLLIGCLFCNPLTYMYSKYKKKSDYVRWEQMQEEMGAEAPPSQSAMRRDNLKNKYNL